MTSFCCPTVRSSGDWWDWCHCAILSRSRADTIARAAPWQGTVGDTLDTAALLCCTILYTAPYSTQSIVQCAGAGGAGAGAGDGISRSGGENTRDAEMRISSSSDLSGPDNSHHRYHVIGGSCQKSQERNMSEFYTIQHIQRVE